MFNKMPNWISDAAADVLRRVGKKYKKNSSNGNVRRPERPRLVLASPDDNAAKAAEARARAAIQTAQREPDIRDLLDQANRYKHDPADSDAETVAYASESESEPEANPIPTAVRFRLRL